MKNNPLNKKLIAHIHNKPFNQVIKSEIALGCRVEVCAYHDDKSRFESEGYVDSILSVNSDGSFELAQGGVLGLSPAILAQDKYNPDAIGDDVIGQPTRYQILGLPITLSRLVVAMGNFLKTVNQDKQSDYYGYDNGLVLFSEAGEICILADDGYSQGVYMVKDWRLVNESGLEATLDDQTQKLKEDLLGKLNQCQAKLRCNHEK